MLPDLTADPVSSKPLLDSASSMAGQGPLPGLPSALTSRSRRWIAREEGGALPGRKRFTNERVGEPTGCPVNDGLNLENLSSVSLYDIPKDYDRALTREPLVGATVAGESANDLGEVRSRPEIHRREFKAPVLTARYMECLTSAYRATSDPDRRALVGHLVLANEAQRVVCGSGVVNSHPAIRRFSRREESRVRSNNPQGLGRRIRC